MLVNSLIFRALALSVILFVFHSTQFNKENVEKPIADKKPFAWIWAFIVYSILFWVVLVSFNILSFLL